MHTEHSTTDRRFTAVYCSTALLLYCSSAVLLILIPLPLRRDRQAHHTPWRVFVPTPPPRAPRRVSLRDPLAGLRPPLSSTSPARTHGRTRFESKPLGHGPRLRWSRR